MNHKGFDLPLPQMKHVSNPHFYRFGEAGETEEQFSDWMVAELEAKILKKVPKPSPPSLASR